MLHGNLRQACHVSIRWNGGLQSIQRRTHALRGECGPLLQFLGDGFWAKPRALLVARWIRECALSRNRTFAYDTSTSRWCDQSEFQVRRWLRASSIGESLPCEPCPA